MTCTHFSDTDTQYNKYQGQAISAYCWCFSQEKYEYWYIFPLSKWTDESCWLDMTPYFTFSQKLFSVLIDALQLTTDDYNSTNRENWTIT
jgi:hypothetical protein